MLLFLLNTPHQKSESQVIDLHKTVYCQRPCVHISNTCLPEARVDVAWGNYIAEKPLREEVDGRPDAVERGTFS